MSLEKDILFVESICLQVMSSFVNSAGVPYLRGFLEAEGYRTAVLNFNKEIADRAVFTQKFRDLNKDLNLEFLKVHRKNQKECSSQIPLNKRKMNFNSFLDYKDARKEIIIKKLCDYFNYSKYDYLIKDYKYIGFSLLDFSQLPFAFAFSEYVKTHFKNIKIIFGGPLVSYFFGNEENNILKYLKNTFVVDFVIIGDGECPLRDILGNKSLLEIDNLLYLEKGEYKLSNRWKQEIKHEIVKPLFEKGDDVFIRGSNDCYWNKCRFCSTVVRKENSNCLPRNIDEVIKEIIFLRKSLAGDNEKMLFRFTDNAMNINFLNSFSEKIVEKGLINTYFRTYLRFEDNLDYSLLQKVKQTGFGDSPGEFIFGIETTSPRLLKVVNKGIELKNIYRIIKDCVKLSINIHLCFIFNLPTQTELELRNDLNFIYDVLSETDNVFISGRLFSLKVGTEFYDNPGKYNIKILRTEKNRNNLNLPFVQLNPNALSRVRAVTIINSFISQHTDILDKLYFDDAAGIFPQAKRL